LVDVGAIRASIRNPASSMGLAKRWTPIAASRSVNPARPCPEPIDGTGWSRAGPFTTLTCTSPAAATASILTSLPSGVRQSLLDDESTKRAKFVPHVGVRQPVAQAGRSGRTTQLIDHGGEEV
jgi:hypothetical protein